MPCWCYQPEYVDTQLTTVWLPAPLRTDTNLPEYVDTQLTTDWLPAPFRTDSNLPEYVDTQLTTDWLPAPFRTDTNLPEYVDTQLTTDWLAAPLRTTLEDEGVRPFNVNKNQVPRLDKKVWNHSLAAGGLGKTLVFLPV